MEDENAGRSPLFVFVLVWNVLCVRPYEPKSSYTPAKASRYPPNRASR